MRFVDPATVRIALSEHEWIDVKKELTVGERMAYLNAGIGRQDTTGVDIDWSQRAMSRVLAYLVDWSEKTPVSRQAVDALCAEDFARIEAAILAHEQGRDDAQKK